MLSLPPSVRVFVARGATDLRKAYDGLASLVQDTIREDPQSGHLFVFFNRRRNRVKILVWDSFGYWLMCKRLEVGQFRVFDQAGGRPGAFEMRSSELMLLLEGIDLRGARRRVSYDEMFAKHHSVGACIRHSSR